MKVQIIKQSLNILDSIGRFFANNTNPVGGTVSTSSLAYKDDGDSEHTLDVHRPDQQGLFPVVVYAHGGGWLISDKSSYTRVSKTIAREGYVVFNINYRLMPGHVHPAQLQDVTDAVNWVYKNARRFGGDPSQIFLAGDSAGAHLVSWFAAAQGKPQLFEEIGRLNKVASSAVKGLVLFYGVYNFFALRSANRLGFETLFNVFFDPKIEKFSDQATLASPVFHVDRSFPPTLVIAGESDFIFQQSAEFANVLKQKGAPVKTFFMSKDEFSDAGHAFLNFYTRRSYKAALAKANSFLSSRSRPVKTGKTIYFPRPTNNQSSTVAALA